MTKSILLQTIETPNGDTDAYEVITFLLEEQVSNYGSMPCDAEMYSEALSHLNQLMEKEGGLLIKEERLEKRKTLSIHFPDEESRNEFFGLIQSQIETSHDCGNDYFWDRRNKISYQCPDLFDGKESNLDEWWEYVYNRVTPTFEKKEEN